MTEFRNLLNLPIGLISRAAGVFHRWKKVVAAGRSPFAIDGDTTDEVLDRALRELGKMSPGDSFWERIRAHPKLVSVVPEELCRPHVREWISLPEVGEAIKDLAVIGVVGGTPKDDQQNFLVSSYMDKSGEAEWKAKGTVQQIINIVQMRLETADPNMGGTAIVQAGFKGVQGELGEINQLVQSLSDEPIGARGHSEGDEHKLRREPENAEIADVFNRISRMLLEWPSTIDGTWIERPELLQLETTISENEPGTTLLLGGPGQGKSALLSRLAECVLSKDLYLLAIKADQVPAHVSNLDELGNWIGTPIPTVDALRKLSEEKKVVVLIDQLDALADLMDIHSQRLSALLSLVSALQNIPGVQIILSCREFECRNDLRLNSLDAHIVRLEQIPWENIQPILSHRGVPTENWSYQTKQLLCTPQHLSMFVNFLSDTGDKFETGTYLGLLEAVLERVGQKFGGEAIKAAEYIAGVMSDDEELWVARHRFSMAYGPELDQLESASILKRSSDQLSICFTHQTLFDHLRARSFLREGRSIAEYVIDGKNESLFVRPILWSAMNYLRSADWSLYLAEMERLWCHPDLRYHLRRLLIAFLGQQTEPQIEESQWLLPLLDDHQFRPFIFQSMVGSPGWLMLARTQIERQMIRSRAEAFEVVSVLSRALQFEKPTVLGLVKSNWTNSRDYFDHALRVLENVSDWSEQDVELASRLVARPEIPTAWVSNLARKAVKTAPELAPKIIAEHLASQLKDAKSKLGPPPPKPADDADDSKRIEWQFRCDDAMYRPFQRLLEGHDWHDLDKFAAQSPRAFLEFNWQWLVDVLEELAEPDNGLLNEYRGNRGLSFADRSELGGPESLPLAYESAIKCLADTNPSEFIFFLQSNEGLDLVAIHHLLSLGLERIAASTPVTVLEYLLADERRFAVGDFRDRHLDTKRIISTLVPALNGDQAKMLETAIIQWPRYRFIPEEDEPKLRFDRQKWTREHRLELLMSFPSERLSEDGRRYLERELRAFPYLAERAKLGRGAHLVGSPMTASQMTVASNDDIQNLFTELTDETGWHHPSPSRIWRDQVGGSIEASREFAEFAKNQPDRALEIISGFHPGEQERPAGNALAEIATNPDISTARVLGCADELIQKGFSSVEFRAQVAQALGSVARREMGLETRLCEMVESWLSEWEAPTPVVEEEIVAADSGEEHDKESNSESILWGPAGFNILPQGNLTFLETIMVGYLRRDPPATNDWLTVLERHLDRPENSAVWHAICPQLKFLRSADTKRSTDFLSSLWQRYPEVLNSEVTVRLLAEIESWITPELLNQALAAWLAGEWDRGPQAAGEIAALYRCRRSDSGEAIARLEDYLGGKGFDAKTFAQVKLGAAHTLVMAWKEIGFRKLATPPIVQLIADSDEIVDTALGGLFQVADPFPTDEHAREILTKILDRPQILVSGSLHFVVDGLRGLTQKSWEPELIYQLVSLILDEVGGKLGDFSTSLPIDTGELIDVALTLHRLPNSRDSGLELFERLMALEAYGVADKLKLLDRRPFS